MGSWARKLNVTHTFTANFCERDFYATLLTNDPAMLKALVLTAQAFIVLDRPKNTRTEKSVTFWLEGTIVNRLWLLYFAKRPRTDHLWRREPDSQGIEFIYAALGFQ
jgi:hypothetical protein